MKVVAVAPAGSPAYEVRIGPGLLARLADEAATYPRALVVSDANVAPLYLAAAGLERLPACVVEPGEGSKRLAVVERVLDEAARAGLDRRSAVIALGGGVVGDLAGLAASLYMRGIACVQAPTSLLAQVDSSVGGKTGVDLAAGKNLAGTFHHPALVLADTAALATLPDLELRSGLGEVVKTALVAGEEALRELERAAPRLVAREPAALAAVVERCVAAKAAVVARDPREAGERKVLNLGHTFAHAIEHAAGYGRVAHGVAVACGLALALATAREAGVLEDQRLPERVDRLLAALALPRGLGELRRTTGAALEPADLLAAMGADKKGSGGRARFVLPRAAGRFAIDVDALEVVPALLGG